MENSKTIKWYIFLGGCILALSAVIFRQYIFGGYFFLSQGVLSDLLRANLPTYYQLYDAIAEGGEFWSWKMGIGTSMFTHADVYFDPFTYVLFIFGRNYIPNMMIWLFILKLVFEGISLFLYLDYYKLDKRASFIASILYAFSGYSLIMGSNFALGTILVYAPFVFLGIEKWIDSGKLRTLFIGLFLICIYSYYFFYVTGILAVIYLCVRLYQRKQNPIPKLFILAIVAIAVVFASSFSILPQIYLAFSNPRVSGTKDIPTGIELFIPQIKVWITALIRTINGDILGSRISSQYLGYSYFGSQDYFQVSCFSSALTFILLAQYCKNEKKNRKNVFLVFMVLSVMTAFPIFSYILNAFSTVNARWMFAISIVQCLGIALSIDSIIKREKMDGKSLVIGTIFSVFILVAGMYFMSINSGNIDDYFYTARNFFHALAILYVAFAIIYFIQKDNKRFVISNIRKIVVGVLIFFIIIVDEGINYFHWYGITASVSEYDEEHGSSYDDTSAKLVKKIMEEDSSFYRIHKDFDSVYDEYNIPSENDAMAQQYYGLKCYNSLNNTNYITFLQNMGIYVACPIDISYYQENGIEPTEIVGNALNYINGTYDRYDVMSYLGVKYFMTKEENLDIPDYFEFYTNQGEVTVYKNNNYMPLAFVNNNIMMESDFKVLSDKEKDEALFKYTIVSDDMGLTPYKNVSNKSILELSKEKRESFYLTEFSSDDVKFIIDVPNGGKILSFTMPYDKDWYVIVDGKEVETCKVNISLLGAYVNGGKHEIELVYRPKILKLSLILSVIVILFCIIFGGKCNNVLNSLEIILKNSWKKILDFTNKINIKDKISRGLIISIYFFLALVISIGGLLILRPSTFKVKYNINSVRDFENLDIQGLKVENNVFEVQDSNAGFRIRPKEDYSYIQIKFKSVENKDGLNAIPVKIYNTSNDNVQEKYVSNDKLRVTIEHSGNKNEDIWISVQTNVGNSYVIDDITFYSMKFGITVKDFTLWMVCGIICLFLILYAVKQIRNNSDVSRDSRIELCRIVCMLMIIAHHCVIHGGAYAMKGMSVNRIISLFLIPGGKLCFDCFLAISCWFLVDQDFRTRRFLKVWFMTLFYSVAFTGMSCLFGMEISPKNWLSVFLPITGNSHGFAAAYLAFYLLLPFLTMISKKLNKKQARWLMIILLYFEVGSQLIGCFNQYMQPFASEILLFILCYFIAFNLKKWPIKIIENSKLMLLIFSVIWIGLFMVRFQYVQNENDVILIYIMNTMCDESSISNLIGGFAFFFFFKNMKVNKMPVVNFLATGTFGVLLIHDHNFFRNVLWKNILQTETWYASNKFVIYIVVFVILVYAVCFIIDKIRFYLLEEKIFRLVKVTEVCDKCDEALAGVENEE